MTATVLRNDTAADVARGRPPSRLPGFLLGLGYGGFIDGIVLHQILQWHHMLSDTEGNPMGTLEGKEANVVADGFFHTATWVFVFLGMVLTVRAWQQGRLAPSWRFQLGLLLAGWGVFNLVEGIVDHHLLQVHHVRDDLGAPLSWDLGFLAFGALLTLAGWALHRRGAAHADRDPRTPAT